MIQIKGWVMSEIEVRMSIDVPKRLHTSIKMHALLHSETIRKYVLESIIQRLKREHKLNAVTRGTLEKSDRGEELTYYDNFEDFYKKL